MRIETRFGRRGGRLALSLALAGLWVGCGDSTAPGDDDLRGGALATFEVSGERFHVWVTNDATIAQMIALRDGRSQANIPNGALRLGPGPADHNVPWAWHMDATDIEMAEAAIEVCDGRPSLVDELLDTYMLVGRFCPWGASLVSIDDRR